MPVTAPTTTTTGAPSPTPSTRSASPSTGPSSPPSPRRAGLSEQAAVTAIEGACRTLHLPTIRDRAGEAIAAAERGRHTYAALLAELLLAECDARDERRRVRRVQEAGFPRPKRLEDFDTDANPNIHPATLATLATGDWVRTGTPVCLLGDSGTGKSHLLIGLGTAAAEAGYRVRYVLASRLVNELAEAQNDRELTRVIARYGRVDLLCLDELGYLQLDRRGAELLFQVLTEREERNAIAIATNEPFSGWTKTFTDPRLCAAIVDRLTFNGHIIETGTTSYRLAHTRAHRPEGGAK
jgi:DNA replication protein DnaC